MRKRIFALWVSAALLFALPGAAQARFGLEDFDVTFANGDGTPDLQAGSHPFAMTTSFAISSREEGGQVVPDGLAKDIFASLPPGFVADPAATPRCSGLEFATIDNSRSLPACSNGSAVGTIGVLLTLPGASAEELVAPLYSLDPAPGSVLKLGFVVFNVPVTIEAGLEESAPYRGHADSTDLSQVLQVLGTHLVLWGNPSDASHDPYRGDCVDPFAAAKAPGEPTSLGTCKVSIPDRPLLTLPRSCRGPLRTDYAADSWQAPGARLPGGGPDLSDPNWARGFAETHDDEVPPNPRGMGGCGRLGFNPRVEAQPTSRAASSPSGLDFTLEVADEGLTNSTGIANADIEKVVTTLPRGITANPSLAEGLEVCTKAQLDSETAFSEAGDGCPEASKIGTVDVQSPLLDEAVSGALYVAEPYENYAGNSLIALYIVIRNRNLGIVVTQPLRVEPDPDTGQLITTAEDLPQLPFSRFRLHFREGGRSPLIMPPECGSYDGHDASHEPVKAKLYPSSGGAPVESSAAFEVLAGPNGGPCPSGGAPFNPDFEAGTLNNAAGSYSPFTMRLARADGEQDMGRFSFTLPPGVVPKLAGIPYCSEEGIARARSRTGAHGGQEEIDDPSCPAASQIGRTVAGAGVGSQLTYVPGKLYLAGPYNGDPISAVAITPAVAGPFDAGVVVVREALRLNPVTHVGEVDGSASDPIPHILKGIPLNLRDLRVYADRPDFTLNPTSCEPFEARSTIWGDGTALEPLAPHPVDLSSRFQAADCAALGFEPSLALRLYGGTKRGGFPALRAIYAPRKDEQANLSRLALTFPTSAFIEQGHFRTICTRVQFAAGAGFGSQCPSGSIYGHIKVWTPLLDEPLQGPVYLRSSNHNLPDAVFALHGLVDIELATRIDSVNGRLRAIVSGAPDAPVSRAVVQMQGGQKGLFVNSRNLCVKPKRNRARVNLRGQNARLSRTTPRMISIGCAKRRKAKRSSHRRRARLARASVAG